MIGLAQPAFASAYFVETWGTRCFHGFCVPGGTLEHSITGGGTRIYSEWANAESFGNVCNWRIDFRYSDTNGTDYRTDRGPTNYSCTHNAYRRIEVSNVQFQFGQACAEYFSNSQFIVRQCHNITG